MKSSLIRAAFIVASVAALSACGSSPSSIFKNATFSTFQQNGDQYLQLETDVSSQNVVFSGVTLPVQVNGKTIGDVSVNTNLSTGTSAMIVQLDLSNILHIPTPTYSGNLPNGLAWPVTGVDLTKMMAFNVGSNGSEVYLYYDSTTHTAMVGAALTISSLSTSIPASLFSTFTASTGINGLVGLYTGKAANSSGVGFIANVGSQLWPAATVSAKLAVKKAVSVAPTKVQFFSTSPDRKVRDQIDWEVYEMNKHHVHIQLR